MSLLDHCVTCGAHFRARACSSRDATTSFWEKIKTGKYYFLIITKVLVIYKLKLNLKF